MNKGGGMFEYESVPHCAKFSFSSGIEIRVIINLVVFFRSNRDRLIPG